MPDDFSDPAANVYLGVHRVLSWGMAVSTVLYALGVLRAWPHPMRITLGPAMKLSLSQAGRGLLRLDPASLMWAATVVLILTPVVRVLVALAAFWVDRDRKFVAITACVLAVIVLTVVLGGLGLH